MDSRQPTLINLRACLSELAVAWLIIHVARQQQTIAYWVAVPFL